MQVSYKLDPWGHIKSQTGTSVNRQIFTGQEHDENTGLIYFGARYYDPDTARFITQDSYLGEQNTPPSLHRYLYAYSNPTVYVDLYGNAPVTSELADVLHGLADKEKKAVSQLKGDLKDAGLAKELGLRTTSALMGIGGSLIEAVAGAVDIVDLAADSQIASTPFLKDTALGRESQKRLEETKNSMVRTAKKVKEYITTEDPNAMMDKVAKGTKNYLNKTFIEGDLEYTAGFSGAVFEIALPTKGIEDIAKLTKARKLGKMVDVAEDVADAGVDTARKVEKIASKSGLGDASTSPWLADPRAGVRLHLETFREGGSYLVPKKIYERFVKGQKSIGRQDGQFITTKSAMDKLIAETGGDLTSINKRLGTQWKGTLYRIDIDNPLLHNARFPSGFEKGANPKYFRWGGYTSGGMPEIVIDKIQKGAVSVNKLF